jgi:histone H3/H4
MVKKTEKNGEKEESHIERKRMSDAPPLCEVGEKQRKTSPGSVKLEKIVSSIAEGDIEMPVVAPKIHKRSQKSIAHHHIKLAKHNKACVIPKATLSRILHRESQRHAPVKDGKQIKMRVEKEAFAIIREVVERESCEKIGGAREIAKHFNRTTVKKGDMELYDEITRNHRTIV